MQRKIIIILLAISIGLLFVDLTINFFKSDSTSSHTLNFTSKEIENRILSALRKFSISDEWISKINLTEAKDSAKYFVKIQIPLSIKQPILLNEIKNELSDIPVELKSSEESIGGNSILKVTYNSLIFFYGKLVYDEHIKRDYSKIAFWVLTDTKLDSLDFEESKSFVPVFELLMTLNDDCEKIITQAQRYGIAFSVLLDDNISDEYAMSDNDSKSAIVTNVKKIIRDFTSAKTFMIDKKSELYNSKIFPLVQSEFAKRKITLYSKQKFYNFIEKPFNEQTSLLNYYCENNKNKETQKIIISFSDLIKHKENILKQRLKGHQIVSPDLEKLN